MDVRSLEAKVAKGLRVRPRLGNGTNVDEIWREGDDWANDCRSKDSPLIERQENQAAARGDRSYDRHLCIGTSIGGGIRRAKNGLKQDPETRATEGVNRLR